MPNHAVLTKLLKYVLAKNADDAARRLWVVFHELSFPHGMESVRMLPTTFTLIQVEEVARKSFDEIRTAPALLSELDEIVTRRLK